MSTKPWNPLDPKIKMKHAITFFDGNQSNLASTIALHDSQISRHLAKDANGLMSPIHAYRLREACPEIIKFCTEIEQVEVSND